MPKLLKTYSRFEGGLNTKTNARSIKENELSLANNVIVDEFGIVKNCGLALDNDTNYPDTTTDASVAGYGFFQSRFDYDKDGNNTPTIRTFLADTDATSDTRIDILDAGGTWVADQIDLGTTTASKVIYDVADGAVRVCDANLGSGNTPMWYGYINRELWYDIDGDQLSDHDSFTEWLSAEQGLYKPWSSAKIVTGTGYPTARGLAGATLGIEGALLTASSSSSTAVTFSTGVLGVGTEDRANINASLDLGLHQLRDFTDDQTKGIATFVDEDQVTVDSNWSLQSGATVFIAPDAGLGFNVEIVQAAATAVSETGMTAATYEFAQTFIYDEIQETLPSEMAGFVTVAANKYLKVSIIATRPYNKRITGGRIYLRDSTTKGEWQLLADISLIRGCRTSLEEEYRGWASRQVSSKVCTVNIGSNNLETFETLNGYPSDVDYNHIGEAGLGYKTSLVSNRRRFIANVKTKSELTGLSILSSDTIRYSEINKFDTFIPNNFIDIGVNDGEEFIKLESYADRLLAFKEKTLYVINIGGGSDTQWFLESEHKNMGVEFHAATVKTDFGIAWVNKNGLFFYDGSQIRNLQTKIHQTEDVGEINSWNNFVNKTYIDTMIGYEPKRKHLIIIRDAGSAQYDGNSGDAFIYSFETNSFSFVENFAPDAVKTNMITDAYNNLSVGTALDEIETYDGTPAASLSGGGFGITLKNDDFGLPGVVKKVYGMTVEYSSSHSSGSIDFKYYHTDSAGTKQGIASAFTPPATAGDLDVFQQEFKNSGSLAPISANSFQPHFSCHNLNGIHKVHSVTVEYRPIKKRIT